LDIAASFAMAGIFRIVLYDFHIGTAYKYDHHTTYDHPRVRTFHYGIVLQGHVNGLYVRVD
jgi:hypothetical protein